MSIENQFANIERIAAIEKSALAGFRATQEATEAALKSVDKRLELLERKVELVELCRTYGIDPDL